MTPSVGRRSQTGRRVIGDVLEGGLVAALAVGVYVLIVTYESALRDPRYLDGWLLAAGMVLQIYFHVALKAGRLAPKSAMRWRKLHVLNGYLLVAIFILHSDFSWPDTAFEWALWIGMVVISLTGVFGVYISWSLKSRGLNDQGLRLDQISARRAELARKVEAVVIAREPEARGSVASSHLPPLPYDTWIIDLHNTRLRPFFEQRRNRAAHLVASRRPLDQIIGEIDQLAGFLDKTGKDKLERIKTHIIEKYQLDATQTALGLSAGWLYLHVPATYAMAVLIVAHVVVVYAFSSGAW